MINFFNAGMTNAFLESDFRGLLIADFPEALENCDTGDYKTLTHAERESLDGTKVRVGKRKSNATRELFPSPYDMTKLNMDVKRKNRMQSSNKTSTGFYKTTKESDQE